jgi:hypothetical protein
MSPVPFAAVLFFRYRFSWQALHALFFLKYGAVNGKQ